jgi:hypothetical protein
MDRRSNRLGREGTWGGHFPPHAPNRLTIRGRQGSARNLWIATEIENLLLLLAEADDLT